MKTFVDEELESSAVRYRFRFGCEHCAHYAPDEDRCAEGFPHEPHVRVDLRQARSFYFCKSFELE